MIVTTAILGLIASILTQLFKDLLPEKKDEQGQERGPRRFLPVGVLGVMTAVGTGIGAYQGEDLLTWGLAGFLAGAVALGYYAGAKSLLPSAVNSRAWLKLR